MLKGIFLAILIVALIVVGQLITIWALNTLFPVLAIAYTLDTWAAAAICTSIIVGKAR
jgi:hypothetical protein